MRGFIIDFIFEVTQSEPLIGAAAFALRDRELYSDVQRAVDCRNQSGTPTAYARWSTGGMSHPPLAKILLQTSSCSPMITTTATDSSQHRIARASNTAEYKRIRFPVALFDHGNYEPSVLRQEKQKGEGRVKRPKSEGGKGQKERAHGIPFILSLSLCSFHPHVGRGWGAKRKKGWLHRILIRLRL